MGLPLDHLERDLPTTPEDVAALSALAPRPGESLLPRLAEISAVLELFPPPREERKTFEGCAPFEL
jgi:hypothetical protein